MKRDCPRRRQRQPKVETTSSDKEQDNSKRQAFSSIIIEYERNHFLVDSATSMCNYFELFDSIDDSNITPINNTCGHGDVAQSTS